MSLTDEREFELTNRLAATFVGFLVDNPTAVRGAEGLFANAHRGGAINGRRPATFSTGLVALRKSFFALRASLLAYASQQAGAGNPHSVSSCGPHEQEYQKANQSRRESKHREPIKIEIELHDAPRHDFIVPITLRMISEVQKPVVFEATSLGV